MQWNRTNHGPIEVPISDYLQGLFEDELSKGNQLKVCVGTDSQKKKNGGYTFATVIIVERKVPIGKNKMGVEEYKGAGAMEMYATKVTPHYELNERMIREVQSTVEVAFEIFEVLDLYGITLELHADINQNPKHKSNTALKSAIGYMSGIPCEIRVKPLAYAASTGADKHC